MTKKKWKSKVKRACINAGTYQKFYDQVIDALAGILEMRDNAQEKFEEDGCRTIVTHTNKNGSTNMVKNPALVVIMDCNAQALAYWAQLGLTPKAFKQMTGSLNVQVEAKTLEQTLADLGI